MDENQWVDKKQFWEAWEIGTQRQKTAAELPQLKDYNVTDEDPSMLHRRGALGEMAFGLWADLKPPLWKGGLDHGIDHEHLGLTVDVKTRKFVWDYVTAKFSPIRSDIIVVVDVPEILHYPVNEDEVEEIVNLDDGALFEFVGFCTRGVFELSAVKEAKYRKMNVSWLRPLSTLESIVGEKR